MVWGSYMPPKKEGAALANVIVANPKPFVALTCKPQKSPAKCTINERNSIGLYVHAKTHATTTTTITRTTTANQNNRKMPSHGNRRSTLSKPLSLQSGLDRALCYAATATTSIIIITTTTTATTASLITTTATINPHNFFVVLVFTAPLRALPSRSRFGRALCPSKIALSLGAFSKDRRVCFTNLSSKSALLPDSRTFLRMSAS